MLTQRLLALTLTIALPVTSTQAFEITGAQPVKIFTTAPKMKSSRTFASPMKTVYLMKIDMTDKERKAFFNPQSTQEKITFNANETLPISAYVGMNDVPVLDQGIHGTCATFATIAAIDALINKGDYISELCNLELGRTLENQSYRPSGWEGSFSDIVLDQIIANGVITKQYQKLNGCAGKTEYPIMSEMDKGPSMSLPEYHAASEDLSDRLYWEPILSTHTRYLNTYDHGYNPNKVLFDVKKSISQHSPIHDERVTAGVFIPIDHCQTGACASYRANNDTWVLTNSMQYSLDNEPLYGHEMVIIAYDDQAIVVDNEGETHKGLLTLRNSWGSEAGDKGNYYMSYDFFKKYVIEAARIVAFKSDAFINKRRN